MNKYTLEHKEQTIRLIKKLKENKIIADKDMDVTTDTHDHNYYAGLSDGYDIAIQYIREYL